MGAPRAVRAGGSLRAVSPTPTAEPSVSRSPGLVAVICLFVSVLAITSALLLARLCCPAEPAFQRLDEVPMVGGPAGWGGGRPGRSRLWAQAPPGFLPPGARGRGLALRSLPSQVVGPVGGARGRPASCCRGPGPLAPVAVNKEAGRMLLVAARCLGSWGPLVAACSK